MLDVFIISYRDAIVSRARARVASRTGLNTTDVGSMSGIPVFLDQLGDALRLAKSSAVIDHEQIGKSAAQHGQDLLRRGLRIDEVVHDYGDVCQVVSELAIEHSVMISGAEFKTLNLCLDDAIAGAVVAFSQQREHTIRVEGAERLDALSSELRGLINTATLAFESVQSGRVALGGSTGLLHARSLIDLRGVVDRSLAEVRLDAGLGTFEVISAAELIEEVQVGASLRTQEGGVHLVVSPLERSITVEGDRQALIGAVSNLLHNAFKFTPPGGVVTLAVETTTDRVLFHIEDTCGGLLAEKAEQLARTLEQSVPDHGGAGHALSICVRAVKANGGEVQVHNLPGKGCIFTLALPRRPAPLSALDGGHQHTKPRKRVRLANLK